VINQRFRRDLFAKSTPNLPSAEANRELEKVAVGLFKPAQDISFQVKAPVGEFKFDNQVVRAVVANLSEGPLTIGELPERPALKASPRVEVIKAIHTLLAAGQAIVFASAKRSAPAPVDARRFKLTAPYNSAVVASAWDSPERSTLASPAAGTGFGVNQVDRALLGAIVAQGLEHAFEAAATEIIKRGLSFTRDGKKVEGDEATRTEVRQRFDRLVERSMPLLGRLGIVEPA